MNRYRKGYYAERKLIEYLYKRGAVYCTRSAGSHTPIDVIAFFKHKVYAFQVKNSKSKRISKKELEELKRIAENSELVDVYVAFYDRGNFTFRSPLRWGDKQ